MKNKGETADIDISSQGLTIEPVVIENTEGLLDKVISEEIPKTLGKIPKELEEGKG